jgi:predicted ATPase
LLSRASGARVAIPQNVRDVIARRLTHLSEDCNRVLVLASVLGREFALPPLARLSGVSEDEVLERLEEAMDARVISEVSGAPSHLRFAHVLTRDTLYEALTTARRVRLHRLVAGALEAVYGNERGQHLAELAHHAIAGSDFKKGLSYARRAGDGALALLAHEEAARLYEMALDALDLTRPSDQRTRCELLLSLGEAQIRAGYSSPAKNAFREAAGIARDLGLPHALARAAIGYGGRIVWARAGADVRLVPLLQEGLGALANEDVELRATLLARLAGAFATNIRGSDATG